MFKMLKFDFYKIVKSKTLMIALIISLIEIFITPLIIYVFNHSYACVLNDLAYTSQMHFSLILFTTLFVSKDFSSNFMKNICDKVNKFLYIFSKIFYIVVYVILFELLTFLITIPFNYIFGIGRIYEAATSFTVSQFVANRFLSIGFCITIGLLILFLAVLLKKEVYVALIVFGYMYFLSIFVYMGINSIVGKNFNIELYTIFGNLNLLSTYIENAKVSLKCLIDILCYSTLFTCASLFLFKKRSV